MKMESEYTFSGPREEVWDLLLDPEVLAIAMPGTKKMEKVSDNEYHSQMQVKVGPVNGLFNNKITLENVNKPESYTLNIDAKGNPGFVKGVADIQLIDNGNNTTLMKYACDLKLGGRLASLGQRLLDTVGKSMSKQSLEAMNEALQQRLQAEDKQQVAYSAPSQTQFAAGVAKDLLFSKTGLAILAAIVLVLIIVLSSVL